ncbi:MAG: hypothetical protein ABI353_06860 [Isosphaeraceae bacterium]
MLVYSVTKPFGTKDNEFEAYTRLLEEVGIDVSNSPRVPEPGPDRRWLYAWRKETEAGYFVADLRRRTRDRDWAVYAFENPGDERGPVAALEIASVPEQDGYTYYLMPASRERVVSAFPGTKLPGGLDVAVDVQRDYLRDPGEQRWLKISQFLTARTVKELDSLGGIRIIGGGDSIVFQRIPTATDNSETPDRAFCRMSPGAVTNNDK